MSVELPLSVYIHGHNGRCVLNVYIFKESFPFPLQQDLPFNLLNYGLYLLPSVPGKLGKYMDDGRFLGDYVFHGHVPRLEVSVGIVTMVASTSLPSVMLESTTYIVWVYISVALVGVNIWHEVETGVLVKQIASSVTQYICLHAFLILYITDHHLETTFSVMT